MKLDKLLKTKLNEYKNISNKEKNETFDIIMKKLKQKSLKKKK